MPNLKSEALRLVSDSAAFATAAFKRHGRVTALVGIVPLDGEPAAHFLTPEPDAALMLAAKEAIATIVVSESWMLPADNPDTAADVMAHLRSGKPASEHPDAREVVFHVASMADGTTAAAVQFILRPEHGKPTLSPPKMLPADMVSGGLGDMFRPVIRRGRAH